MGNNEVTTDPDHHVPRTNDRGTTSGVRREVDSRSHMGKTGAPSEIRRRGTSVARRTKHSHVTPHRKACPETIWPLSHHQSTGTSDVSAPPSRTMGNTPGVSCGPFNTI